MASRSRENNLFHPFSNLLTSFSLGFMLSVYVSS
jgi:hypothetical protein